MFYGDIAKVETTKDINRVNELLAADWLILWVLENNDHEFVFLMGLTASKTA